MRILTETIILELCADKIKEVVSITDDQDVVDLYNRFIRSAMDYIESVIKNPVLETSYQKNMDSGEYRIHVQALDRERTARHDAVMSTLAPFQRLCKNAHDIDIADFDVAQEREENRGEIANAVFVYVVDAVKEDGHYQKR
jgi:hypothetical protein